MNRVRGGDLGCADDVRNCEVALRSLRWTDAHRLIGEAHVQRARVGLGVNGHGLNAELFAGANDPHCDFAAVGDQYLFEHQPFFSLKSFCPNSTLLPFSTKMSTMV